MATYTEEYGIYMFWKIMLKYINTVHRLRVGKSIIKTFPILVNKTSKEL